PACSDRIGVHTFGSIVCKDAQVRILPSRPRSGGVARRDGCVTAAYATRTPASTTHGSETYPNRRGVHTGTLRQRRPGSNPALAWIGLQGRAFGSAPPRRKATPRRLVRLSKGDER